MATGATAQPAGDLTLDLVDGRINAPRASGAVDDNEIVVAYQDVRSWLIRAESHTRDAMNYANALSNAPAREAEIAGA